MLRRNSLITLKFYRKLADKLSEDQEGKSLTLLAT
jgi:hypothetical protein